MSPLCPPPFLNLWEILVQVVGEESSRVPGTPGESSGLPGGTETQLDWGLRRTGLDTPDGWGWSIGLPEPQRDFNRLLDVCFCLPVVV